MPYEVVSYWQGLDTRRLFWWNEAAQECYSLAPANTGRQTRSTATWELQERFSHLVTNKHHVTMGTNQTGGLFIHSRRVSGLEENGEEESQLSSPSDYLKQLPNKSLWKYMDIGGRNVDGGSG